MSAFYDIWVGVDKGQRPSCTRLNNSAWKCSDSKRYWTSSSSLLESFAVSVKVGPYEMQLIGQLYECITPPELLSRCINYIEGKTKEFKDPAGHYVLVIFNTVRNTTYVFTNRLGTYHIYHSTTDNTNTLGTYYLGLAKEAQNKTLDWEGITGFMQMGFFPNDRTYLQGISVLEPASFYTFDGDLNKIGHKRYWDWSYQPQETSSTSFHEELHHVLHSSLSCSTKEKRVSLPLSGGLDSRTLAGVLTENHDKAYQSLWAYSYGFTGSSVETKIASKIAKACKVDFTGYLTPDYLFQSIDEITDSVELFQYVTGTRQAAMVDNLSADADVVIGGHWGDVWMDTTGVENNDTAAWFKKKIIKRGSEWLVDNVCKEYLPDYNIEDYFQEWNNKYAHILDADFRMKIFKTDQWSFRWTVPSLRMYQAGCMPVLPFYDNRVVELFTKIPRAMLTARRFQVEFIKKYYPKLAAIPWQEYGSNLYRYKTINNRNLIYRGYKKLHRTISGNKPIQRNWELFYLNDEGRIQLEDVLMNNNEAFVEIVPKYKSQALLNLFYNDPSAANGYTLSMLHTLAQFMKTVF